MESIQDCSHWHHHGWSTCWRIVEANVCAFDSHVFVLRKISSLDTTPALLFSIRLAASEAAIIGLGRLLDKDLATASLRSAISCSKSTIQNHEWNTLQKMWDGDGLVKGIVHYRHNAVAHANASSSASATLNEVGGIDLVQLELLVHLCRACFAQVLKELTRETWKTLAYDEVE